MANAQLGAVLQFIQRVASAKALTDLSDCDLVKRFLAGQDETAFIALLKRHGPMVLGVGRRTLGNEHDAEDVFQATFLLLARKAKSIRKHQSVASWLYGVAHRLALNMKRRGENRQARERQAADMGKSSQVSDKAWQELQTALHEALAQVPEKYRAALLMCYLEGKTQEDAARQLGCPIGTVRSRLARGRASLQKLLVQQGVPLSATALAAALGASTASTAVGYTLVRTTAKAALDYASGQAAAALVSAKAAALVEEGLKAMLTMKLKVATAIALMIGSLSLGAGIVTTYVAADSSPPTWKAMTGDRLSAIPYRPEVGQPPAKNIQPPADKDSIAYSGRVVGPDEQPVAGAKLYLTPAWGYHMEPFSSPEYATTGSDGRFKFTVPKGQFGDESPVVAATAPKYGIGWVTVSKDKKTEDLKLQLVDDDVPINGQIIDLEGKPVAGATLRVLQINAAAGEDLGPWVEAAKGKKAEHFGLLHRYLPKYTVALSLAVMTDAEGRLKLSGIGRDRLVIARLDGPTIASQYMYILTRSGAAIAVPESAGGFPDEPRHFITYLGANFRHVAAPTKPIVGVVRDKDTQQPLAGITIQSRTLAPRPRYIVDIVKTTTDEQGRFLLVGMPKGDGNTIVVDPGRDQPYLPAKMEVPDKAGLDPVTVEVELKRGVWIEGKIFDKATGKPVKGAVEYLSLYTNPNLHDYAGFEAAMHPYAVATKDDGSYRIAGMPGPGVVAVYRIDGYLQAPDRDDEYGIKETYLNTAPYALLHPINYSALARIDPPKGAGSVKQDVTLDRGWTFSGVVLGPDGKPLPDLRGFGLTGWGWRHSENLKSSEFTVVAFNPRQPRDVVFQHLEKARIGVAQPPKENGGSVTVRMEPAAGVMGRLGDAAGKPRANIELEIWFRKMESSGWHRYSPGTTKTDKDGKFRVQVLLPRYEFRLSDDSGELFVGGDFLSGQTKDLGNVQLKRAKQ